MRNDEFIGGTFTWFTGVVKDVTDTEYLNRVKVKCFGFYDEVEDNDKLPWATVMMPSTSGSFQGTGMNHNLQVGSWVVGFFRDGPSAQDPVVMGSIATQTNGTKDIPSEAHVEGNTNHVYKSQSGHTVEFDNTSGSETIKVKHAKGAVITIDQNNNLSITNSGTTELTSTGAITITSNVKTTIV